MLDLRQITRTTESQHGDLLRTLVPKRAAPPYFDESIIGYRLAVALDPDASIRRDAFLRLDALVARHGQVLPWSAIDSGFNSAGTHYRFAAIPRGIFRPSGMQGGALSLKTVSTPKGRTRRYDDHHTSEGFFIYRLQGVDPRAYDNEWLRDSWRIRAPMVYFLGIGKGLYHPIYPVCVRAMHVDTLTCELSVGTPDRLAPLPSHAQDAWEATRRYTTVEARQRLHQAQFRHYVVRAYAERCAVCRIPRPDLLDAAHILPDRDPGSTVEIPNGLALCPLHHRAFDRDLLGVRPDGVIELSNELLETKDGPTFEQAFRRVHETPLSLPRRERDQPRRIYLEARYEQFRTLNF